MRQNPVYPLLNTGPNRPMTEKNPNSVEAVKVAVRVLDELALQQRPMGVTELADALGETKPRIHRHLSTLKEMGLIEQERTTDRYHLGWRVFQLGEAAGNQFDLRARAEPYMVRIRDALKETAVLAVPINGTPMVIATVENIYGRILITVKPGNRPLPHCSALGRLTLAFQPKPVIEARLAQSLQPETSLSLTDPARIRQRLDMIRRQFYEVSDGEMMIGVNTIAVPIFRNGDQLAGALAVVGSIQNIPNPPRRVQVEVLQHCAAELSSQLSSEAYADWHLRESASEILSGLAP
ncbi:IclR family transcriptional regulator [Bordetella sp. BOR01]|uniref:IclR family transcriptional regulator n=1 Tax=Bordetella sp. BOR01 TaxID=2854779 RepID=UPI001C48A431|nr:IclR family transcriptional regulator [Bordetella sp. BOR01]MBV7484588.1 IclR family transcriptional regulator [Bordetella sp. BOR01]